jgi:hypothetical protein
MLNFYFGENTQPIKSILLHAKVAFMEYFLSDLNRRLLRIPVACLDPAGCKLAYADHYDIKHLCRSAILVDKDHHVNIGNIFILASSAFPGI